MVSKLFAHSSKALFRTFRETGGALWLREGQAVPDQVDCQFIENPHQVDVDGFKVNDVRPKAIFLLSDIRAIDTLRADNPNTAFKNDGRDTITINGKSYCIESCSADVHGWIEVNLYAVN